jgi:hypothetical protein
MAKDNGKFVKLPPAAKEKLKEGTLSKKNIRTIMKNLGPKEKLKAETLSNKNFNHQDKRVVEWRLEEWVLL